MLDHARPSFATASVTTSFSHDFGQIALGSTFPTFSFDVFNLNATAGYTASLDFDGILGACDTSVLTTNVGASVGSLSLAGGTGQEFIATLNTSNSGTFSATYTLQLSDENLVGALNKTLTLTLTGQIAPSVLAGDYDNNGLIDAGDYVIWRKSLDSDAAIAHNETASPGVTDAEDFNVWRSAFGASGAGAGATAARRAVGARRRPRRRTVTVPRDGRGAPFGGRCAVRQATRPRVRSGGVASSNGASLTPGRPTRRGDKPADRRCRWGLDPPVADQIASLI